MIDIKLKIKSFTMGQSLFGIIIMNHLKLSIMDIIITQLFCLVPVVFLVII